MKELELISKLEKLFAEPEKGLVDIADVGIGDDCAYLKELGILVTTDSMVEGVHFLREKVDYHLLGRKLISVSLSDIAAMGGTPSYVTLNFNIPAGFLDEDLNSLSQGIKEISEEAGVKIIGGDTVRSGELSLAATLIGAAPPKPIFRSGASIGADIWVSGPLGLSALGLQIELEQLEIKLSEKEKQLALNRFNNPSAQLQLAPALSNQGLALSMIDISDGLLTDLEKLLAPSKLGAILEIDNIPRAAPKDEAVKNKTVKNKILGFALGGGEDYELLFTAKTENRSALTALPHKLFRIGEITKQDSIQIKTSDKVVSLADAEKELKISFTKGYEHSF